jgi:predicted CXXCH cytochrome family protein
MKRKLFWLFLGITVLVLLPLMGQGVEPPAVKVDESDFQQCANCHEDQIKAWEAMKDQHPPAADCSVCHAPHSSQEKFFLLKKTNQLCVDCHEDKASGKHVIASFVFGSSHPVDGKVNPLQPERSFSCASCHSPHASNSEKLFTVDTKGSPMNLCQACHKK